MVAAFVRSHGMESVKAAGTTDTYALTATVPAGNLLVMALVHDNAAVASKPLVTSITKMSGESASWLHLGRALSTSTSTGAFADGELWAIKTTVAWTTGTSLTVTYDTTITMKSQNILEYSGVEATLRSTVGTNYSTTTTAASAATTGTTPVIGDLAVGLIFGSNVAATMAGDTDTLGGAWTGKTDVGSTGGSGATNNYGITQHKILTAASHQTLNNSAAMTAGNGAIVAVLQATIDPLVTQAAYRIYGDGTETGSTALAAQDTAPTVVVSSDANVQVRVRLQETAGGISTAATDWQLQWEKNTSGTWTSIGPPGTALVDSFETTNFEADFTFNDEGWGQSFLGNGANLASAEFRMSKTASPTATLTAYLYAHTGTFGSGGTGTGSPLATSTNTVAASSLTGTPTWTTFNFDATYTMSNGTPYVVAVMSSIASDSTNYASVDNNTSGGHAGNRSRFASGAWSSGTQDVVFRVNGSTTPTTVVPYDSASLNVPALADTYPDTNGSTNQSLDTGFAATVAQSFTGNGNRLARAGFHLSTAGSQNGTMTAVLYAHTGTLGTSSTPTGAALATSTAVAASTVTGSTPAWYYFDFDGTFTLANGTNYCIALTTTNSVGVSLRARLDSTSPTHAGNLSRYTTSWTALAQDLIFEVYTAVEEPTTNRLGAGSGSFVAGKVSEDGLVDDLGWTASNYTEVLYSVTLKSADLANADSLRFRVLRNGVTTGMTYTAYPTITVSKVTTPQGTGTGSWSFTGAAVGYRLPKATPTGAWSFAGTAVGKRTPVAAPVGAWSFAGTAVGAAPAVGPKTGTGAGTWSLAGAAVGKRTPVATVTGAWSFAGAAVGKRTPKATPTGAWSFTGAASGVAPVVGAKTGTASGSWSFAGAAVGKRIAGAAPTGTLTWVGAAVGKREAKAAPTGAWTWTGAAVGKRVAGATAAGTLAWSGAAVGKRTPKATTAGTLAWTGAAVGYRAPKATTTGTLTWVGAAVGLAPTVGAKYGTATGAWSFAGAAVGKRVAKAAPTGTWTWTGAAVGEAPPNTGAATGTLAWTGAAVGKRTPKATTTGTFTFTGTAVGKRIAGATATGTWSYAGTAVGYRAPKGTVASTLAWTGTAYGTAPTVGVNEGFAFGSTNWAGTATGTTTRRGAATGTWNLAGTAFGTTTRRGTATTGAWSYTGTTTAATIRRGLATGAWSFTGAGVGKRTPKATATTGAWSYVGYAFGQYPRRGTATGTWTFTGTAAALTTHRGTTTGAWSFAGAATGKRIAKATPTGTWTWVGTAVGKRSPKAAPAGAWVFTGYAFGGKPLRGAAAGAWAYTGTALARTQHRGTAAGLLAYTGAPVVGVAPALDFADGKATGFRHYVGYAVGLTGIPITPASRILVVAVETRLMVVAYESRLLEVPADPRLITVAAETRVVEVPAEIRTAQLEGASA